MQERDAASLRRKLLGVAAICIDGEIRLGPGPILGATTVSTLIGTISLNREHPPCDFEHQSRCGWRRAHRRSEFGQAGWRRGIDSRIGRCARADMAPRQMAIHHA